jgi:hypothetical protein
MNSIDEKICRDTAKFWIENGGDAEGFKWVYSDFIRILEEIEKELNNG